MDYDDLIEPVEGLLSIDAHYYGVAGALWVLEGVQGLHGAQVQVQEVDSL